MYSLLSVTSPNLMALSVNRMSALSDLRVSLYSFECKHSVRLGNTFVTKSSIITPMYASDLSKIKGSFPLWANAAFAQLLNPALQLPRNQWCH